MKSRALLVAVSVMLVVAVVKAYERSDYAPLESTTNSTQSPKAPEKALDSDAVSYAAKATPAPKATPSTSPSPKASEAPVKSVTLSKKNTLVLNSEVTAESIGALIQKARTLDAALDSELSSKLGGEKKPLYLYVYTPGGDIDAGFELIDTLNGLGRPVHTVTRFAASMGFQIVENLGDRYIVKNGIMMSHRAAGQMSGFFGGRSPSQMENRQSLWLRRINEMDNQTVKRTNGKQTLASYQEAYADELWRTGSESVVEGYSDSVAAVKCDDTLNGTTKHSMNFLGIITINYELDDCPLNNSPMNVSASIETTMGTKEVKQFIKDGGSFGPACLMASYDDSHGACAVDTSLGVQKIDALVAQFKEQFILSKNKVVRMYMGQ